MAGNELRVEGDYLGYLPCLVSVIMTVDGEMYTAVTLPLV